MNVMHHTAKYAYFIQIKESIMVLRKKSIATIIIKLCILMIPLVFLVITALSLDPLMIFRDYDDYYKDIIVMSNREYICTKLYDRNSKYITYDSYILGNSRSLAFKVDQWRKYLPTGAHGFHFDASGEGIYGIYNKMKYIDETNGSMKRVLIILDGGALGITKNRKGFLFISPPQLSKESKLLFYLEFIKPFFNPEFTMATIDYSLFKTYRSYMPYHNNKKYSHTSDNMTGDLNLGFDRIIEHDEHLYYTTLIAKGEFYKRDPNKTIPYPITNAEIDLLKKMKLLLDKHKSDYRIVISPLYDQVKLDTRQLRLLTDIFGNTVYDFSGVNKFTESMYNYYESSHYRTHVADAIMQSIYSPDAIAHVP